MPGHRASTNAPDAAAAPIRIGLVALGKIARDQHIPALLADRRFALVAAATSAKSAPVEIALYPTLGAMIAATPELHAVALCTPPQGRCALAREALDAGLHVMLEKPPGVTVGEVEAIVGRARERGVTLFASWHSREAPGVQRAREWIAGRAVRTAMVTWKEDVRKWHPGQQWIWQPGGLGVFDPGINALSIVTRVLARDLWVTRAVLHVPANRQTPIAAELAVTDAAGTAIAVELDFRQQGDERWDIAIETDAGRLELGRGGAELRIAGEPIALPAVQEYPGLYERFAGLIAARDIDVDLAPLKLVADAFLVGHRVEVEPFDD